MVNVIDQLRQMLTDAKIPYETYEDKNEYIAKYLGSICEADHYLRNQIIYGRTSATTWKLDAIYQRGSYGRTEGLVELWGELVDGEPITATAEKAFEIIKADWEKEGEEE